MPQLSSVKANLELAHQPVAPLLLKEHNIPWSLPSGQVQCLAIAVAPAGRCRTACQNGQECKPEVFLPACLHAWDRDKEHVTLRRVQNHLACGAQHALAGCQGGMPHPLVSGAVCGVDDGVGAHWQQGNNKSTSPRK